VDELPTEARNIRQEHNTDVGHVPGK